jgi:hypothetical protein
MPDTVELAAAVFELALAAIRSQAATGRDREGGRS